MHEYEMKVLAYLRTVPSATLHDIAEKTAIPPDGVRKALYWLEEKKYVTLTHLQKKTYELTEEGKIVLQRGFPECVLLAKVLREPQPVATLTEQEKQIGIVWAKRHGWIKIERGVVFATKNVADMLGNGSDGLPRYSLARALALISKGDVASVSPEMLALLQERKHIISNEQKEVIASLTPEGKTVEIVHTDSIGVLTRDILLSSEWERKPFKPYTIIVPSGMAEKGTFHPLSRFIARIREIFIELGFEEMEGSIIEQSFWNFDALFQPQDHPARELADTFYIEGECREPPDERLVETVKRIHEEKWHDPWRMERACECVLRTHTTAVSARTLRAIGEGRKKEGKFFAIGRVYRNEAIDFKHLAEFHQIEGICVWEKATFQHLLGLLREFYAKLGFEKIRFRPSYFPYTEPSVEVEVFFEKKGVWLELGGAGIFRPEVCYPLWGKYPVLAWGLSLERPLMILSGEQDIRAFYRNTLSWLRTWEL